MFDPADAPLEQTTTQLSCLEVWGGNETVDTAVRVPGLEVFVYAAPYGSASAGGDVHFVSSCASGRIARLMVADVSGHGEAVASIGRSLRSLIRRYMNQIDPRKLLMSMNATFTEMSESGIFATAVLMTYFSPTGELSLCNAGHPPPLIFRRSSAAWEYLDSDGPPPQGVSNIPLGILADAGYEQFAVPLQRGDLVLCYTDSLVEAICADGEQVGPARLLDAARSLDASSPSTLTAGLLARLAALGARIDDDVTVVLARSDGRAGGARFLRRLAGQLKFVAAAMTFGRDVPWPEWTLRNVGGSIIPLLSRRKGD